ncbi:MAG: cytochrome c biogenesis protein [Planctomycetes bacterium]|nr:cytochrome c biogenesis protein [Planctomycetota bacterium]
MYDGSLQWTGNSGPARHPNPAPDPMEALVRALHVVVPVLWTAAAAAYWVVFVRDDLPAARWGARLSLLAALLHVSDLAATGAAGLAPLLQPGTLVSGMGLAAALVYLVLERKIRKPSIGVFAIATAALLATVGSAIGDPFATAPEGVPTGRTSLHVAGAIAGYAGLLLAAIFGALLLAQQRALRNRRFGLFWERLPSIELLDSFTRGSLGAATIFLTVTIGLGHMARHYSDRMGTSWDPKVIATNLLWLLTLLTFAARKSKRMRPAVAARVSIGLFAYAFANMAIVSRFSQVHAGL